MALTTRQQAYALAVSDGASSGKAAIIAGFANNSSASLRTQASRLASNPEVQRAIFEHRERRLQGPLASKALACLEGILDDLAAPPQARLAAAKFVLEAAGHGIESKRLIARHPEDEQKQLSKYSLAELEEMLERAEVNMKQVSGSVIEGHAGGENGTDEQTDTDGEG